MLSALHLSSPFVPGQPDLLPMHPRTPPGSLITFCLSVTAFRIPPTSRVRRNGSFLILPPGDSPHPGHTCLGSWESGQIIESPRRAPMPLPYRAPGGGKRRSPTQTPSEGQDGEWDPETAMTLSPSSTTPSWPITTLSHTCSTTSR